MGKSTAKVQIKWRLDNRTFDQTAQDIIAFHGPLPMMTPYCLALVTRKAIMIIIASKMLLSQLQLPVETALFTFHTLIRPL